MAFTKQFFYVEIIFHVYKKKYIDYPDRSYLQIVESYQEDGKVRNRVVLNLGRFDNEEAVNKIEEIIQTLLPYSKKFSSLDIKKDFSVAASKQFGPLLIICSSKNGKIRSKF